MKNEITELFKKYGVFASIVFLFVFPFYIWKSGRIGKTISIASIAVLCFWGFSKASDVFFPKWYDQFLFRQRHSEIIRSVERFNREIKESEQKVYELNSLVESYIDNQKKKSIEDFLENIESVKERLRTAEENLKYIEDSERMSFKEKIISIREQVKVSNVNKDTKQIRLEAEKLIDGLDLLTKEDRIRFINDFRDVGIELQKEEETYQRNSFISSMDSVVVYSGPMVSMDSVVFNGYRNRRKN